jgi:hypothetical protein
MDLTTTDYFLYTGVDQAASQPLTFSLSLSEARTNTNTVLLDSLLMCGFQSIMPNCCRNLREFSFLVTGAT